MRKKDKIDGQDISIPPKKSSPVFNVFRFLLNHFPLSLCVPLFLVSLIFYFIVVPSLSTAVGTAIGSFEGVTEGIPEALEAGAEAGLSAEDTVAKIGTKMTETGNLEVMLVDMKLADIFQQGEPHTTYAILWDIECTGIFSVDLTQATVIPLDENAKQIKIIIPEPIPFVDLDDRTAETIAEYKSPLFDGSAQNGYTGYLNSRSQIALKAEEQMLTMLDQAESSARNQVEILAKSVCVKDTNVEVYFAQEVKE